MDDQVEDIDLDEEEEEYEEGSFRRWGLVIGIGVGVVCLGLIMVLWFGRDVLLSPLAQLNPTETATVTNTELPTATFTVVPATDLPTSTATLPPSPTPMRLPAMEIMALVSGPPVMDEPFDDNSRTWTTLGENSEFTIQEGSLIVQSKAADQPGVVYCSGTCGPYKDFYYYEAEVVDESSSEFGYGLIFALNDQKNAYYAFKVRPQTSEYGLFKFQNGALTPLIDWTSSPAVLPAPQVNILGASFLEKHVDLYLNGTKINSFQDNNALTEGQVGFTVDQDGVRLTTNRAVVYELIPRTPQPTLPGQQAAPTLAPTATQPGAPAAPAQPTQPGQPAQPTAIPTTPGPVRPTATATRPGSCPAYVPEGQWLLVVTVTDPNARRVTVEINGTTYELKDLNTPFYLMLEQNYTVRAGGRTYDYNQAVCKVVYIRAK